MSVSLSRTTDRRKLLTTGLAAGLFAASGVSIASRPRVGGRLRAALPGAAMTDSWDARKGFGLFMAAAAQGAVFDCLTEVAADGTLRGELATGWEASRDAKLWVFDLRGDVRFHDGTPFDAASVVETVRLHLNAGRSGAAWEIVENIDSIRASGPNQVQFHLKTGNADFPYLLSDRHMIIYPAGKIAEAMREGIGTGLYRVARFEPGERFLGWRMADHYRDGSAGWFDQIEFLATESGGDRFSLLTAGRVDAAAQVDPFLAKTLSTMPDFTLSSIPGNQHVVLDAGQADPKVAQVLKLAVDRDSLLLKGLNGHGHIGHDSPVGPFNQYYETTGARFDPSEARALLNKAGFEGVGLGLLALSSVPESLTRDLWPSLLAAGFGSGHDQQVKLWLSSGRATEDWAFANRRSDQAGIAGLRAQARAELDPSKRAALYSELQAQFRNQSAVVIPVFANFLQAMTTRIITPALVGNLWPMDNARFAERWWMS